MSFNLPSHLPPGVHFVVIEHDDWCPLSKSQVGECLCNAVTRIVSRDSFVETLSRSARRERDRRARKAAKRKP